jgi:hypothetical protein
MVAAMAAADTAEVVTAISTNSLPAAFKDFIAPDCDRKRFILDYLSSRGIRAAAVPLGNAEHLVVQFPATAYNPTFHIKTILAHYDRFPGSPGANDNSAAVCQVMDWAVRLQQKPRLHNVRIIFTDGEEVAAGDTVAQMGSFSIASRLKSHGSVNDDVYVFDCTGRGDVAVLSKAGLQSRGDAAFQKRFASLYHRTEDLLRAVSPEAWFSLPVPYSDNAGFLACGIPAVCITMLPAAEASAYLQELRQDKTLEQQVMARGHRDPAVAPRLPVTWQLLHTKDDIYPTLTPRSFALMGKLLDKLGNELCPA